MTGKEYALYVVAKNDSCTTEASERVTKATTLHGEVTLAIEQVSTSTFKLNWNKINQSFMEKSGRCNPLPSLSCHK